MCTVFTPKHWLHLSRNKRQDPTSLVLQILNKPNPFLRMQGGQFTFRHACEGCFLHSVSKAKGILADNLVVLCSLDRAGERFKYTSNLHYVTVPKFHIRDVKDCWRHMYHITFFSRFPILIVYFPQIQALSRSELC